MFSPNERQMVHLDRNEPIGSLVDWFKQLRCPEWSYHSIPTVWQYIGGGDPQVSLYSLLYEFLAHRATVFDLINKRQLFPFV
jgi:hypothetical protein